MQTNIETLTQETMALYIEDRAALAGKLILSLDEPKPSELEQMWLEESERRLEAYRAGRTASIPADDVFRRALSELK
ncbi:MAG: addiction module protein [Sideroxydans sp.]|nr:addiction module protein [Sideroxydans sp.]